MPNDMSSAPLFLLVVSGLILAAILVKRGMESLRLPAVVGYLFLGLGLRALNEELSFLSDASVGTLDFLGQLGVASLLFHVGLRSNLGALIALLPRATGIWISDVAFSSVIGFFTARWLGFGLGPALFVGVALSATSVGISVTVWEDAGAIRSKIGQILLDVAELDDLSAIVLLLIVLSVTPSLVGRRGGELASVAAGAVGVLLLKVAAFAAGCWFFAAFVEKRLSDFFARSRKAPDPLMVLVGFGFGIAALAGCAGVFGRGGRDVCRADVQPRPGGGEVGWRLHGDLFAVHAVLLPRHRLRVRPRVFVTAAGLGGVLFVAAVAGKFVGAGLPIVFREGWKSATVLGISMAPRAEIALLAVQMGRQMGPGALPEELYGAVVLAAAGASIMSPLALHGLLAKWPEVVDDVAAGSKDRVKPPA